MAIVYRPKLTRYTRHGERLGRVDVDEAVHVENLDGTDELTITTGTDLAKGDYIVWFDRTGRAHEHIVDEPVRMHDSAGRPYTKATCINSIAETWDDWVDDLRPEGPMATALRSFLGTTRWVLGTVTVGGSKPCHAYHKHTREAIAQAFETYGGELETEIVVLGDEVAERRLSALAARGDQESSKRFTWTKDLISVRRTVGSANPKSRIYGYGKGVETDTGGYGRRLTFADINGGREYVEDSQATQLWGKPDASGNVMPACGVYVNDQCEDAAQLLQETRAYLDAHKAPEVTYEADVIDLVSFGRDWEDVGLGDSVAIIDREFSEDGLRLQGRVSQIERDLLGGDVKVTFGTLSDVLVDQWTATSQALKAVSDRILNNVDTMFSDYWMTALQERMNDVFAGSGTYIWSSYEKGYIFSTVPLDENGKATTTPASAMNITGSGFRIADELTADGDWNWKNFGTGSGFLLNCLVAGVLTAGRIQSADGTTYWDLDNSELRISAGSSVGGRTVANLLQAVDATITDVDVEYASNQDASSAPLTGWSTTPPTWQSGYFIWQRTATSNAGGATYSEPVCISGRDGIDGAPGAPGADGDDGVGISSTDITYGKSSSESVQPSSWQASAPALTQGDWLWVKTVYTYTNSTTATVYTKSYVGTDGDDGASVFVQSSTKSGDTTTVVLADGNGNTSTLTIVDGQDGTNGTPGANGLSGYVHTAWANSADGSSGFSTSVSAGKAYLGVYTDNTAADSQSYSDYSWSLIKGADGTDGDDGVGISSIQEQQLLTTMDGSTPAQTPTGNESGWSSAHPAWEPGKYIWTRSLITWDTTPASTTTTAPVLARALTQANRKAADAAAAVTALDTMLDQEEIFNRLTDNGNMPGLFMQGGQLYVNASYILSGILKVGGANNVNGVIQIYDADGNVISTLDNAGAAITGMLKMFMKYDVTYTQDTPSKSNEMTAALGEIDISVESWKYNLLAPGQTNLHGFEVVANNTWDTSRSLPQSRLMLIPFNASPYYGGSLVSNRTLYLMAGVDNGEFQRGFISWIKLENDEIEFETHYSRSAGHVAYMYLTSSGLYVQTNLSVSGTKTRLVETRNYADRSLYAYETPAPYFGDIGSAKLDSSGVCVVSIDDMFAETARTDFGYQVFLQACGEGSLYVESKSSTHFIVRGTPNLAFDWEIKAHQRDYELTRMECQSYAESMNKELNYDEGIESAYNDDFALISELERIAYEAA